MHIEHFNIGDKIVLQKDNKELSGRIISAYKENTFCVAIHDYEWADSPVNLTKSENDLMNKGWINAPCDKSLYINKFCINLIWFLSHNYELVECEPDAQPFKFLTY